MSQFGSIQVREGDLLAGKYRIERVLGVGGMGIVVAARHEELGQLVAIKFVKDESLANEEAVERFLRESRSAARLRSEHVARVLDVGRLDTGAPYMVMEFLEGSDLGQVLTRDGPMPVDLAAALMLQVCEAVAEAHAAGIVHRDLKPENLFLTTTVGGSPKMKVLDFGVSKSSNLMGGGSPVLTKTSAMLGSPLYMAPEQMRSSRDVDARLDVWALGVVLFELLTHRSPFEAETMPELCLKIVGEAPLSLESLRPDLPPGIVSVIYRCLEKEREKRYGNAAELARALEPFAPARASFYPGRQSIDAMGAVAGSRASQPSQPSQFAPPSAGPQPPPVSPPGAPGTTSIPAWGAEGRRSSVSPSGGGGRGSRAAWMIPPFLAIGALIALLAVHRTSASPSVASAAAAPPAVSPLFVAPAVPPPSLPLVVLPPVAAPPAAASSPSDVPVSPVSPPIASTNHVPPPVSVATAPAPRLVAKTPTVAHSGGPDDDIPALR